MRKQEIDHILGRMLDSNDNVSDLNITVGKPFQVESSGQLTGVEIDPPVEKLTPFQSEIFALNLINQDRRLTETLLTQGFYCYWPVFGTYSNFHIIALHLGHSLI